MRCPQKELELDVVWIAVIEFAVYERNLTLEWWMSTDGVSRHSFGEWSTPRIISVDDALSVTRRTFSGSWPVRNGEARRMTECLQTGRHKEFNAFAGEKALVGEIDGEAS